MKLNRKYKYINKNTFYGVYNFFFGAVIKLSLNAGLLILLH